MEDGEKIDLEIGNLLKDSVRFKMGLKKFDFFFVGCVFGVMGVFQCASVWRRKREDSV
jgi:hypothetical protein